MWRNIMFAPPVQPPELRVATAEYRAEFPAPKSLNPLLFSRFQLVGI